MVDSTQEHVDATLEQRKLDYGYFADNAGYAQQIKEVYRSSPNWVGMHPYQREALEFMASKIGRLLSGDPHKADTWLDLAGYARLVETNLGGVKR